MCVDAGDHGSPLPRLIGERGVVRVVGVRFVPVRECGDFAEGRVRYLDGEQAEEGLARLVVVSALGADEVERGEGVGVVAVGGFGIVGVILQGRCCSDSPHCFDSEPSSWRRVRGRRSRRVKRERSKGRLEERVCANVVKFGEHVLVAVRSGQRLDVFDDGIDLVLGTAVSPFAPVTRDVSGGRERVAHQDIIGTHRLLGVIGIVAIGEGMSLVKAGLLGGAGGRTDVAAVAASEVDALRGELIEVGRADVRLVVGFALGLTVGANRAPAHVVDVEVEDVGTLRFGRQRDLRSHPGKCWRRGPGRKGGVRFSWEPRRGVS